MFGAVAVDVVGCLADVITTNDICVVIIFQHHI